MDRRMVYPGQVLPETVLLNMAKDSMLGLSKLAAAILGTGTIVNALACVPDSPASLNVSVGAGEIYSLQNVDDTAFSSLAADTTHQILKQGVRLNASLLSCPAPGTAGQSINYLIQATYQDADSGSTVLPYYNSSNPASAWSGPANSGSAQNTVRTGVCTVSVKAGTAATTGTQTTPTADAGYVGLYVVTVAQGATTIISGNITVASGAPFITSTLTNIAASLALKAPLASPPLTGTPTAPTAAPGTNTTQLSTTAFVQAAITALINGSPGALDTLKELADALADDANFATTITNALTLKAPLLSPALTGNPTAPTQSPGDNSTKLATTAYVQAVASGLGSPSQNLTDVTGSRAIGTTYTNSTGAPIEVRVSLTVGSGSDTSVILNGITQQCFGNSTGANIFGSVTFTVKNGATYSLSNVAGLNVLDKWVELR